MPRPVIRKFPAGATGRWRRTTRTAQNSFYVEIRRAGDGPELVTNDREPFRVQPEAAAELLAAQDPLEPGRTSASKLRVDPVLDGVRSGNAASSPEWLPIQRDSTPLGLRRIELKRRAESGCRADYLTVCDCGESWVREPLSLHHLTLPPSIQK